MAKHCAPWPTENGWTPKAWIERILALAIEQHYADLYFKSVGNSYRLSGQVDGTLRTLQQLTPRFAEHVLSVIKYWALLNLAEKRRPQLGRFTYQEHFIRVSVVGDFLGKESLVIRLLQPSLGVQRFTDNSKFGELLTARPNSGLYLIAGPTGAGKTSTLYRLLRNWSKNRVVLTVEDPVEYVEPEYLQLQVNETANIFYEDLIKVALRQRPDILVIGEIRDKKTAHAALQAALSGHLVLATIHANSALLVVDRLLDLGLDATLVSAALVKSVYQRLEKTEADTLSATLSWVDWKEGKAIRIVGDERGTRDV